ncbi:MAG: hypothetical protein LUC16_01250 [Coprobacillus sp.]|nr:hypothetical protein [Coprobacillus sp.]
MSYEIIIDKKAEKYLNNLTKGQPKEHFRLDTFIYETLAKAENPCMLPNAKHLQGFRDNRYRWRLGDYRIIGIVKNGEFKIIKIIKISKKDDNTYK